MSESYGDRMKRREEEAEDQLVQEAYELGMKEQFQRDIAKMTKLHGALRPFAVYSKAILDHFPSNGGHTLMCPDGPVSIERDDFKAAIEAMGEPNE
ncbi:MAG: hypothetical protein JKY81_01650 [Colwellia sp.]|nr:hypothetical protein [Colwellia sp.]